MSSCEYCEILKNTISTKHLRTTASLVRVHRIISFKIISRITVKRKNKGLTRKEPCHIYLPWNFLRFLKVVLDGVLQKFITAGTKMVNVSNKISSITSIDAHYCNIGQEILLMHLTWLVRFLLEYLFVKFQVLKNCDIYFLENWHVWVELFTFSLRVAVFENTSANKNMFNVHGKKRH